MRRAEPLERRHQEEDQRRPTESPEAWGDQITPKAQQVIRIGFQNVQGLPADVNNNKFHLLQQDIKSWEFDAFGIAEHNLNFHHLPAHQQWKARTRAWPKNCSQTSYNRHTVSKSPRLFGGTTTTVLGSLTNSVTAAGQDSSGLGRWSWIKVRGKAGSYTRIISGYRPVQDNRDAIQTVYAQQEVYLLSQDDDCNPRLAFVRDLQQELESWLAQGEQLVVMMDANENVRTGALHRMLRLLNLRDCHQTRHPRRATVATCEKNRSHIPIDAIWTTEGLDLLAAGYLGYREGQTMADHRLLWIELSQESCMGHSSVLSPPGGSITRLNLKDPRTVQRYNRFLLQQYQKHQLPEKLFRLQATANLGNHTLTQEDQQTYDRMADLDHDLRKAADRQCRKLRMGAIPFSENLCKAQAEIHLWKLLLAIRKGNRASHTKIRRLMRYLDKPHGYQLTLPELEDQLQTAYRVYRRVKKDGDKHRKAFTVRLLAAQAEAKGTTSMSLQQQQTSVRKQKAVARDVKEATGKGFMPKGFSILEAPTATANPNHPNRHLCTTKEAIEQACFEEGARRYSQANGTPCLTNTALAEALGSTGTGILAQELLAGTADLSPYNLEHVILKFLNTLKRPLEMPTLDFWLDAKEHRLGWNRMKGHTQSSPDGPGFAAYKASCQDDSLADVDATFATLPLQCGFTPRIWKKATDVMIPKKQDSFAVEKLRIIVLFNALFNMVNKRVGRSMLQNAESQQALPAEAYGSRKHHRAAECALNKVLTTDYLRLSRSSGILCSNDAQSCYDRIIHSVASICMQRMGVPPEVCHVMFGTIQDMQHRVRTVFGDSHTSYGCIQLGATFQGVLQGNGAGPAIWLVVSAPIIELLKSEGFGLHITSAFTKEEIHFVCYTFVDDTDLIHTSTTAKSARDLVEEFQQALDHWEGGLRATGGALAPSKSYWYYIDYTWRNDKWHMTPLPDELRQALQIRSTNGGGREPLTYLPSAEAQETLGVWIAMDGNQKAQFTALQTKMCRWADKIRTNKLSGYATWYSLMSCIYKTLEYPLLTTCLSPQQCKTLVKPLLQAALPGMGLTRNMPRVILHGGKNSGGLAIPDVWVLQGIHKLWAILQHGHAPTITGLQLRANIEETALILGTERLLFDLPFDRYQRLVPQCWVKSLWQFLDSSPFRLKAPHGPFCKPLRQNDCFLMDFWGSTTEATNDELNSLNICRIWLKAITVGDVCSGDGKTILAHIWNGNTPCNTRLHLPWPAQGKPSRGHWTIWRKFLEAMVSNPRTRSLIPALRPGPWLQVGSATPLYSWWYTEPRDQLLYVNPLGIWSYRPTTIRRSRNRQFGRDDSHVTQVLPGNTIRTQAYVHSSGNVIATGDTGYTQPTQEESAGAAQVHSWTYEYLRGAPTPTFVQAIRNGTAIAVCDGSYKDGRGTAGFVFQPTVLSDEQILGCNRTTGHPEQMSAYRSELGGILAITVLLSRWCQTYQITQGHVTVGCDCYSALHRIQNDHLYLDSPDYDLLVEIRNLLTCTPITWTWKHIKGHQDNQMAYHHLDPWAQLNVQMDSIAKHFWNLHFSTPEDMAEAPIRHTGTTHLWTISIGDRRLTSWDKTRLYDMATATPTREYWTTSGWSRPPARAIDSINWEACGQALHRLTFWKRLRVIKWNTNNLPTGVVLRRRQHQSHSMCPRCQHQEETLAHVIRCPHPTAQATWNSSLATLEDWLTRQQTDPALQRYLLHGLRAWHEESPLRRPRQKLHSLHDDQQLIGWEAVFSGFLSLEWLAVQQQYYDWLKVMRTGKRWVTQLIRQLWIVSWQMWEHRCGAQQDPNGHIRRHAEALINRQIRDQYARGFLDWRPLDLRWCTRPAQEVVQEPLEYKEEWLHHVRTIRDRNDRRLLAEE